MPWDARARLLIEATAEGVRLRPSWVDGWWWLSSLLYEQDRFSEAQAPLKRFIAIAPAVGVRLRLPGALAQPTIAASN